MKLNKEERNILLEMVCNEQLHMIKKDVAKYKSCKYKTLEKLKVKLKNI